MERSLFVFRGVVLAIASLYGLNAAATEPPQIKYHQTIQLGNDPLLAEYTYIGPVDDQSPRVSRTLYQHAQGDRLVIRASSIFVPGGLPAVSSFTVTIESIETGEIMEISLENDTIGVLLGGGEVSWSDGPVVPAQAQQQAAALMANVSSEFSGSLYGLAVVGVAHSPLFNMMGQAIADLLFPGQVEFIFQPATTEPTEVITEFDPSVHPPGVFEQPFGAHYYD